MPRAATICPPFAARVDGGGLRYVVHAGAPTGKRKVSTGIKLAAQDGRSAPPPDSTFG
jgi:hypothetical protein